MDTARIDRFASRTDAEMACSMLSAHGFNARVTADDAAGVHPDIPFGIGGTAVVVPRAEYADAVALLDADFEGQPGGGAGNDDTTTAAGRRTDDDPPVRLGARPVIRVLAAVIVAGVAANLVHAVGRIVGWW